MSRPSLARRALMAGVASLAAVSLTAGAAAAASLTVDDGRGDVWKFNMDAESEDDLYVPAPGQKNGDVTRVVFRHTDKRVVMRSKFAELDAVGRSFGIAVRMRDQDGKKRLAYVETTRRDRAGSSALQTMRGKDIECNVKHKVNYDKNVVKLSFPRTCVGNPRYLQFTTVDYLAMRSDFYLDNPHNAKAEPKGWTKRVRHG